MQLTPRQREIMRAMLIYGQANLDDVNEVLACGDRDCGPDEIKLNGEVIPKFNEDEVAECIDLLQG